MVATTDGQIITFYSYKGGTGRSMALANVGYLLATQEGSDGKGVLMIDWDLEAPGLHRFFQDSFMQYLNHRRNTAEYKKALEDHIGLIDFFVQAEMLYDEMTERPRADIRRGAFNAFERHVMPTDIPNLSLLKAGSFDATYAERIRKFNWEAFYQRDPEFFREFRGLLKHKYAYILIDSRTGLTDTSGICTRQMPEKLVIVFVPNHQNLDGVVEVIRKVRQYRFATSDLRPLDIFPLASRIDAHASRLRDTWRHGGRVEDEEIIGYQRIFENLLKEIYELDDCVLGVYFDATQVNHDSDCAYGERIAARYGTTDRLSMGYAYANFTKRLITLSGPWESLPEEEAERRVQQEKRRATELEKRVAGRSKLAFASAAAAVILGLVGLWMSVGRPLLSPKFTEVTKIVKYTAEPAIQVQLPVADVSCGLLDQENPLSLRKCPSDQRNISIPKDGLIRGTLGSLSIGRSLYQFRLVGGLFSQTREVPIEVVYYPGWEIHQFPDARLAKLNPILQINGRDLELKDVRNGNVLRTLKGHKGQITSAGLSPDRERVLLGGEDGSLKLWDVETEKEVRTFAGHQSAVLSVAFAPDSKTVLSGSADHTLKLWDVETEKEVRTFAGHQSVVLSVAFAPDGKTVLFGSADHTLKLWDVETGETLWTMSGHNDHVSSAVFSGDGKRLLSGSSDGMVKLWNTTTGQEERTFKADDEAIRMVAFSPDGRLIFWQSVTGTSKVWEIPTDQERAKDQELQADAGHRAAVLGVAFAPDDKMVLSGGGSNDSTLLSGGGSNDSTLKLWDVETGKLLRTLSGHSLGVNSVAFAPDGKTVLSGSEDKTLRLWNVQTGEVVQIFSGHDEAVLGGAFAPNGQTVLSGSRDKTLRLWNVQTGEVVQIFSGHDEAVLGVAFAPNGQTVLSGSADKTLRLWEVQTGKVVQTFSGHDAGVLGVAFAPNGQTVLSGSRDKTLRLWNVQTGEVVQIFSGHNDAVRGVAFAPNGQTVLSGSADKTLRLWDVKTEQVVRTFSGHGREVLAVAFARDGERVLSGSADTTLKLWWAAIEPKF
jgi:WD40 repeat protein